jgi:hypothetical protein
MIALALTAASVLACWDSQSAAVSLQLSPGKAAAVKTAFRVKGRREASWRFSFVSWNA